MAICREKLIILYLHFALIGTISGYIPLSDVSLQVGDIYCGPETKNVQNFLNEYDTIKNIPGFALRISDLLEELKNINSKLKTKIDEYSKQENGLNFENILDQYFNSKIYVHIRYIQCLNQYITMRNIEDELMAFRSNPKIQLRNVFDDGSFRQKILEYIKENFEKDLKLLDKIDDDIFNFRNENSNANTAEEIVEELIKLEGPLKDILGKIIYDVIIPEHDRLIQIKKDFTLESLSLRSAILEYYEWLPKFIKQYEEKFIKHYL